MSSTELNPYLGYSCAGSGRPRGDDLTSNRALVSTKIPEVLDAQLRALAQWDDVSVSNIILGALEKEGVQLA
jgi:hypothetical protein